MSHKTNIGRIKIVYDALGELRDKVVFVGGATVSLYADRMAEEVRPTDDIDVLIELWNYSSYAEIETRLREMGFKNDITSKFVGRYIMQGLKVDIMPTSKEILGFTNKWYPDGLKNAVNYIIDEKHTIRIFTAPYLIASKLEAFRERGKNKNGEHDGRSSADFEDIVFVLDNRNEIWNEIKNAEPKLKSYLQEQFALLLKNQHIEEWLYSHTGYGSPPSSYYILQQLEEFVSS